MTRAAWLPLLSGVLAALCSVPVRGADAVWQWSVPAGSGRAYLWIPENCTRVRAMLLAQHNLIERGILEHPRMRRALAELGIAEVFIAPSLDAVFRFDEGAGERFDGVLRALAAESGYDEIATAPVAPMGHSAHASFPWNYAAWNPGRTLAALSLKGDAPLTGLTGCGRPNPAWGDRTLDGVPGLMVMSEQEWWEARLVPLLEYRAAHPAAPIALLADAGHGHFDATDRLVEFLALFLRKVAALRLCAYSLKPVDPAQGWLIDRWRGDGAPRAQPAPYAAYAGERAEACWCPDGETAQAIEAYQATSRGKRSQQVGFMQEGAWRPVANSHAGTDLDFRPEADGLTFRLSAGFIAPLPANPPVATKDRRPPVVAVTPEPAAPGAHASGSVTISVIVGPVVMAGPGVFRVAPDRMYDPADRRTHEAWFLARHPGDATFKPAVRQARLLLPRFDEGVAQTISFPPIPDHRPGAGAVPLVASSDAGLPVGFHVREGPAVVRDGALHFTPLPPRTRFPVKITVVAWQFGRGAAPGVRAAPSVERTFLIRIP
jgi:hypothetical protein